MKPTGKECKVGAWAGGWWRRDEFGGYIATIEVNFRKAYVLSRAETL
jgi:hypothetical protein